MVRNKPSGDAFGSNRRSPTMIRRRRDEMNAAKDAAANQTADDTSPSRLSSSPRSTSPTARVMDKGTTGPAEVSVEKKNGFFEIKGNMSVAADPDVTYGILTDYEKNPDIFKTVSKVEVEHNDKGKFVTQHAHWNLLFWSGTFDMKMKVEEDPSRKAVSYKLNEPGFLKMFNGYWDVEPRMVNGKPMGCNVVVTQEVLPSMLPPGPLASYVSRILGNQVKAVLQDLSVEAERVQQSRHIPAK
ncbi:hypothetical protein KC19_4G028000 [Ceratodon purpureus]|uniref:Coenzyme Q-binding protein COQ10 START domain-containing protein n=1 Tax=Ceratodon purpureus TaxID=3225 RepID=A0A8T0I5Y7_CERPU|nr:hypothetical protein KC19_4G028000 [Ceratodon purpureus]